MKGKKDVLKMSICAQYKNKRKRATSLMLTHIDITTTVTATILSATIMTIMKGILTLCLYGKDDISY